MDPTTNFEFNYYKAVVLSKLVEAAYNISVIDDDILNTVLKGICKDNEFKTHKQLFAWVLGSDENRSSLADWYYEQLLDDCEHDDTEEWDDEEDHYNGQGDYTGSTKYHVIWCNKCGHYIMPDGDRIYE